MTFLRGTTEIDAVLVHSTGTIVRFTTGQLSSLPATDADCILELPDGQVVSGRFHRHDANPYIAGPGVVGWIKSWLAFGDTYSAQLDELGGNKLRLELAGMPSRPSESLRSSVRGKAARAARERPAARRRKHYEALERDPQIRRLALAAWGPQCQVDDCSTLAGFPGPSAAHLVDVHHLNHVGAGGSDSPLNLSLVCVAHHALIHRGAGSRLVQSNLHRAEIEVEGETLALVRDARRIL